MLAIARAGIAASAAMLRGAICELLRRTSSKPSRIAVDASTASRNDSAPLRRASNPHAISGAIIAAWDRSHDSMSGCTTHGKPASTNMDLRSATPETRVPAMPPSVVIWSGRSHAETIE
jgi:hypothetical protein